MAKSKTEKTKAPTGLVISRNKNAFTLAWKIGDVDYKDGQYFSYEINDTGKDKWSNADKIRSAQTSKKITVNSDNFYPKNKSKFLYDVRMRVKGNRDTYTTGSGSKKKTHKPGMSDWSSKIYTINKPRKPSLSAALIISNQTDFSWEVNKNDDDAYWFTDVEWQTIRVKESQVTDGSKLSWKSTTAGWATGVGGITGTVSRKEDTTLLASNSYTRWFRIRSRGPRGASDWVYAKHVYAMPYRAKIKSGSVNKASRGYNCKVAWEAAANAAHPIDQTTTQYVITTPLADLVCPAGANYIDGAVSHDTKGKDAAAFYLDDQVENDECLYVRVNTQHDNNIRYSNPSRLVVGRLSRPEDLEVEVTSTTLFKATITATNQSAVPDSFLVVLYRRASQPSKDFICGIIPHGQSSVNVRVPSWEGESKVSFGVYAAQGSYARITRDDYITQYSVSVNTDSKSIWQVADIPAAPENVAATYLDSGQTKVTWDWTWKKADNAEISWSDHEDAWNSTAEPEIFSIDHKATTWYIADLEMGKKWWIRVRLLEGDQKGPWSDKIELNTARAPLTPLPVLSDSRITPQGSTTLSWTYVSMDTTQQSYAEVAVRTGVQGSYVYTPIAHTETSKALMLYASQMGWVAGHDYALCVRVTSESNLKSPWSEAVTVHIATPLTATITQTSLQTISFTDMGDYDVTVQNTQNVDNIEIDIPTFRAYTQTGTGTYIFTYAEGQWKQDATVVDLSSYGIEVVLTEETTASITLQATKPQARQVLSLTQMPMTVTVTGAGAGGTTSIVIERTKSYYLERPDENKFTGYEGEAVVSKTQTGERQFNISLDDLIGTLDDGAEYQIVATVKDGLGQSNETKLKFEVHWTHQALVPSAIVVIDETELIAKITPIAPTGAISTDVADIYRLSIDKPELIVQGAHFGETYVDPYPALGDMGGHRVVLRTANGDYITEDNTFAMIDSRELDANTQIENSEQWSIIDFENQQIKFYYNIDYSNTWAKDFQETHYLGGSVQGDWNAAVSRSGTLSTQAITVLDQEMLQVVRRLAEHSGICHVRTADGSSYAADVQVSEDRTHTDQEMLVNYSLSITRVDNEQLDGMTLAQWEAEQQEAVSNELD